MPPWPCCLLRFFRAARGPQCLYVGQVYRTDPTPSPWCWARTCTANLQSKPPEQMMAPTKQQILDSLARIAGPDGAPLTASGKLSEVMVSDGKVFFSITVDAAAVQA